MKEKCSNCGELFDTKDMIPFHTGRTHWYCWECYKLGQSEVTKVEIRTKNRRYKELKGKKIIK